MSRCKLRTPWPIYFKHTIIRTQNIYGGIKTNFSLQGSILSTKMVTWATKFRNWLPKFKSGSQYCQWRNWNYRPEIAFGFTLTTLLAGLTSTISTLLMVDDFDCLFAPVTLSPFLFKKFDNFNCWDTKMVTWATKFRNWLPKFKSGSQYCQWRNWNYRPEIADNLPLLI
jgi:hypothetical protein